jgi:hypothetical protein
MHPTNTHLGNRDRAVLHAVADGPTAAEGSVTA